jgi:hypothetical protein
MRGAFARFVGQVLVALLVAAEWSSAARAADEWSFLKWQMTPQQAKAALAARGFKSLPLGEDDYDMYAIPFESERHGFVDVSLPLLRFERKIGNVKTVDFLLFREDRLDMIAVSTPPDRPCSVLFGPMKNLHGKPVPAPLADGTPTSVYHWRFGGKLARLKLEQDLPCRMLIWPG